MPEPTISQTQTLEDAVNSVTALQLAVDTLGRIAEFGGVQGAWSVQTLQKINEMMLGAPRAPLRAVEDPLEAATGSTRR